MKLLALACAAPLCAPCSGQWSVELLSQPRAEIAATAVGPYAVFAGGRWPPGSTQTVDLFDSSTETWSTASLAAPAGEPSASAAGGLAFVVGGGGGIDVFDAATAQWSTTTGLELPGQAAASHGDLVFFAGGGSYFNERDDVTIIDTSNGTQSSANLSVARLGLAATSVGDVVLFAGGSYTQGSTATHVRTVDVYEPATNTWSTSMLTQERSFLAATTVGNQAIFAGGRTDFGDASRHVDIYDASSGTWSHAQLSQARWDLAATTVGPYAVFAGGRRYGAGPGSISSRVDLYDSRSGTWSTTNLVFARARLAATTVGNRAFFAGGETGQSSFTAVVEVFEVDVGTEYCSPAPPNSTGLPGVLRVEGSTDVADGDLTLIAEQLPPGQFGYFLASLSQGSIQPPASQGPICLSGNIARYNGPAEILQGPMGSLQLDLTGIPVNPPAPAAPGDTWNFQCWYRDVNPGSTSNTTNATAVTFQTPGDPAVQFAVTQGSVVEQTTLVEVLLTLSQPANQDVVLAYVTGGTATENVDWRVEEPNPFVIPAGAMSAEMTLLVAEDAAQEGDELAIVSLAAPVGAVLGTQPTFTLTIVDDD